MLSITLLSAFPSDFETFRIDKPLKSSSPPFRTFSRSDWGKDITGNKNSIAINVLNFILIFLETKPL
jgi:hypothetical protein